MWNVVFNVKVENEGKIKEIEWRHSGLEQSEAIRFEQHPLQAARRWLREIEAKEAEKGEADRTIRALAKELVEVQRGLKIVGTGNGAKLTASVPMLKGLLLSKGISEARTMELLQKIKDSGMCEYDEQIVAVNQTWLTP